MNRYSPNMTSSSVLFICILLLSLRAQAALPDGSKCVRDSNCDSRCFKGYCTSEVGYGGTCDYKWECKGALVCRDRKCQHKGDIKNRENLKGNGELCMSNKECKNVCIKERCESRRRAGRVCSRSDQCYGKLVCRNGKCQRKKGFGKQNGKKCTHDFECVNICLAGYCRNARFFGQKCFKNIHCKEELICVDRVCRSPSLEEPRSAPVPTPRPARKPDQKKPITPKTISTPKPNKKPGQALVAKKEEEKPVKTKEGKTKGAQAAIQVSTEQDEPKGSGLLRNGKGKANTPTSRSDIIKFFFCMVHQDECPH